jgi:hypothetical protein
MMIIWKKQLAQPLGCLAGALIVLCPAMAHAVISAENVRCDYQSNPLGIDAAQPRLSWTLQSNQRGDAQTAYRILAASSPALLAANTGDVWDSGKVVSTAQNQIPYGGSALTNHQQVFWKVQVWDAADAVSAWSTNGTWTMGVLQPADWTGQWITLGNADAGSTLLRRGFSVGPNLKRALVNICGLGQYELRFNGQKVGSNFLSPGWTKYDKTVLYDTFDVTALLASGPNAVGVMLGNGMYNVPNTSGRYLKFSGTFGPRKVIAQLRLEYNDGSVQVIGTDAGWRATTNGPIRFNTIYGGEDYDARQDQAGWDTAVFNDSGWSSAVVTSGPGGVLRGASFAAPPIQTHEVFTPTNSWSRGAGITVYDLGQNAAQIPTITVHGPAGATVKLVPSELVNSSGDITPIVSPSYCLYTLKGGGPETFTPRFFYTGYRYVQVELRDASGGTSGALPVVDALTSAVVSSASPEAGTFSSSSTLFDRIRKLIKWAQRSNAQHVITDCPQREKLGWLEQYYLHGPSLRYEQDFAALYSKCAEDMEDSQLANGLVPDIAPEYTVFGGGFRDSPEWGSAFIFSPWQQYEFYGETQILSRHYAGMKAYVDYLSANSSGYIVNYGLGDWFDLGPGTLGSAQLTPVAVTATATYYAAAKTLSQIAALLGNTADAATYATLATNINSAFNAQFANADGSYSTGSQTANAMPLVLGMVPAANRAKTQAALVQDVRGRGYSLTAGDIGHRYLLRALADAGRSDVIFDLHSKTNTPGYGYILNLGATALTEGWDGSASQNHFMLGHIIEWFYHDLAGIQPDPAVPGFQKIIIQPAIVGDVTWAAAGYNSIRGMISNRWELNGNQMTMNVSVPVGATATVWLPTLGSALTNMTVTESGATIWQNGGATGGSPGVSFNRVDNRSPGQSGIAWDVASGSYQFQWSIAPTPTGLRASASGARVDLNWNAAVSATGYQVKRATVSGGPYAVIAANVTATNFTDLAVTNGTTYYYVVAANSGFGMSLDSYEASARPALLANAGFETPVVGTYQYDIGGGNWTFSPANGASGSGISANGSGFTVGNPNAPEGVQVAFLQGTGVVSQTLTGLIPGRKYSVAFLAAQRNNVYGGQVGQTWNMTIDGAIIASYAPPQSATSYAAYSGSFTATNATQTLAFVGSNLNGGDNTVFLDDVRVIPKAGLAVYPFEGNALDRSGNQFDGTAVNVTFTGGKVGAQAAQFNGTSSYVAIPRCISNSFTVALWLKTTNTASGTQWWSGKGLVDGEVAGSTTDWGTAVLNGKFAFGVGNPDTTISSATTVNDGVWHHLAASRDAGGGLRIYVDGVLENTGTGPTGSRTAMPALRIGGIQTGASGGFLDGTMDEVRLYDYVLDTNEIRALTLPPQAPATLIATAGDGQVLLTWGVATNADAYHVKRSTTSGGPYTAIAGDLPGQSMTDADVTNGVMYYYVAAGTSSAGESADSVQAAARPVSTGPTQLNFSLTSQTLGLNWPSSHTGWELEAQTNHLDRGVSANTSDWVRLSGSSTTNRVVISILPGTLGGFYRLVYP